MTDVLGLIPPWLVKEAIDALPSLRSARQLLPYLGMIVLVVSGQAIFRLIWRRALFGVSRRVEYELRNDLFRHLQTMDRPFYLRYPVGDLMSRSTNDLVAIQEFIAYFGLVVVDSCLIIVMALLFMTIIDPLLAVAAMIPMPLLSVSFFYFGRRVRGKANQVQEGLALLTHLVQETLTGVRVIQAYTLEKIRNNKYRRATEGYIDKNLELARLRGIFYATLTLLAGLAAVIVLWIGGDRVISGHITLGGFVAFNSYLIMLTWPMMSVGFMVNLIQRGRASMDRLDQIFSKIPTVADPVEPVHLGPKINDIRFHQVSFRYPGADRLALKGISLCVPIGSKIGITGPVGSGKTTLLELLPRLFDPTEGMITLGGQDIRGLALKDVRSSMSWVAQEPFLFSDSIAENIRFSTPDRSDEEVSRFAHLVCLDKDEDAFPRGWETVIGERGVMVSGGQRQRIALARALLNAPHIILLDDAFAHLDEATEIQVLENLLNEFLHSTILFVSHRIASLRRADRIVVLQDGFMLQEGSPDVLIREDGYFRLLWHQQKLLSELDRLAQEQHEEHL